ncbi:MAG: U32 family peptidase [Eubacteriales bacterium]|nr:U32 family peptidase [Eubacteriales bacterium]
MIPNHIHLPELLAPAGSLEALEVAVKNGADAVYFGLDRFSARSAAKNLTLEQLPSAIRFLHEHSSRGYLALNTLLRNDELPAALELAHEAAAAGIDAIIVQDPGLIRELQRHLPEIPLHGSTQMTLARSNDMDLALDLGLERIVLPRELSGPAIAELAAQARQKGLETEVFIHGALCICFSGQCLMSSLIGGRSGNRGACAQPCRLDYQLGRESGALYSPKDQALLPHLPELVLSGVRSLKIEGRMRSPAYVGQAVGTYRLALDRMAQLAAEGRPAREIIDRWPSETTVLQERLLQAFNRDGSFTTDYWHGHTFNSLMVRGLPGSHGVLAGTISRIEAGKGLLWLHSSHPLPLAAGDILSVRRPQPTAPEQAIASAPIGSCQNSPDGQLIKGFHPDALRNLQRGDQVYRMSDHQSEQQALQADNRTTAIRMTLTTQSLTAKVESGPFAGCSTSLPFSADPAVNPLQPDRTELQLKKTGGTAFRVAEIALTDPVHLTIGQLNALRREVLAQLGDELARAARRKVLTPDQDMAKTQSAKTHSAPITAVDSQNSTHKPELAAFFHQLPELVSDIACGADVYILPLLALDDARIASIAATLRSTEPNAQIVVHWPPLVTGDKASMLPDLLAAAAHWPTDGVCTAWPAYWDQKQETRLRIADTTANLFNTPALVQAADRGATTLCPSLELNIDQLTEALADFSALPDAPAVTIERPLYGRLRLMSTAYCPIGKNQEQCRRCVRSSQPDDGQPEYLTDRKGARFLVVPHPRTCQADLLGSDLLAVPDEFAVLQSALGPSQSWRSRLYFIDETVAERRALIQRARQLLTASPEAGKKASTDFLALAQQIATRMDTRLTTGHYQRGVI